MLTYFNCVLKLMGRRPFEGYHLCFNRFLAIATVIMNTSNLESRQFRNRKLIPQPTCSQFVWKGEDIFVGTKLE